MLLTLGSPRGGQGFWQTKMRNGGRVLSALPNLYAPINTKIRARTFDTNRSVTDSMLTVNGCFNPEAPWSCFPVSQHSWPWTGGTISLSIDLRLMTKTKQSNYRPGRPWGFQEVEAPRFQDSQHMKVVRWSALRTGRFYPQEIFLVLISLRGWVNPRAIVRPVGIYQ